MSVTPKYVPPHKRRCGVPSALPQQHTKPGSCHSINLYCAGCDALILEGSEIDYMKGCGTVWSRGLPSESRYVLKERVFNRAKQVDIIKVDCAQCPPTKSTRLGCLYTEAYRDKDTGSMTTKHESFPCIKFSMSYTNKWGKDFTNCLLGLPRIRHVHDDAHRENVNRALQALEFAPEFDEGRRHKLAGDRVELPNTHMSMHEWDLRCQFRHELELEEERRLNAENLLQQEKDKVQALENESIEECVVCFEEKQLLCIYPCGHQCICQDCFDEMTRLGVREKCPECRTDIIELISVYKP